MVTLPEAIPEPLPDAEGISQYNMAGGLFRGRGMWLLILRSGAGVRRTGQKDEGQMRETIRKKVMADKQEYIPRQVKHAPLYELEQVDDLGISPLYKVRVDGKRADVFGNEFFHFAVLVYDRKEQIREVEVTVLDEFETAKIRPSFAGISFEKDNQVLKFRLPAGKRVVLEIDDDLLCPLYLLQTERVERPGNTSYEFQKGSVYNIDTLELKTGDVVYIEEGAVVSGRIWSRMADHIRIVGNGILYGGNWHKWNENGAEQMLVTILGKDIEIRGITLLDGGSWHVVPTACEDVRIDDINVLGKVITGDGIDIVGCKDVTVRNCFVRANDDCISVKAEEFQDPSGCADVKHILMEDCLFWNAEFGNVLEIGYETRCDEISDVVFRRCEILHCEYEGNQSGGVLTIHNADRAFVHDIHYEDIRIEDAQEKFIDIKTLDSKYSRDRSRGMICDIRFKNIEITEGMFPVSIVRGFEMKNEVYRPHDLYFENIVIHGKKMACVNDMRMVKELSDGFHFV